MTRGLEALTIYRDETGAPWWALAEVAQMLHQPDTSRVARAIERGKRRRITEGGRDWRFRKSIHLIDGRALIEACLVYGQMPGAEVREYVRGQCVVKQSESIAKPSYATA